MRVHLSEVKVIFPYKLILKIKRYRQVYLYLPKNIFPALHPFLDKTTKCLKYFPWPAMWQNESIKWIQTHILFKNSSIYMYIRIEEEKDVVKKFNVN